MATMQECETIEKIAKIKNEAKRKGISTNIALSGGKEYYRRVIASVRNSGIVAMITSTIIAILLIIYTVYGALGWLDSMIIDRPTAIGMVVLIFLIWLTQFQLGYKTYLLESTPRFILGCLIINFIINILMGLAIFPIISIIFGSVAIARWSTYKDWFYNFDKIAHEKQG